MSISHTAKECDIFTRACKSTAYNMKKSVSPEIAEDSKMAEEELKTVPPPWNGRETCRWRQTTWNRRRRRNLRLFGLKEGAEGTQQLTDFIQDMLPKWLSLGPDGAPVLERAHCTLATAGPNRHRAILIRFWKFQDKEMVYHLSLQKKIQHDGANLAFVQDFSAKTMRQRNEFNRARQLFTEMEIFHRFCINPCRLRGVYNGKIQLFSKPKSFTETSSKESKQRSAWWAQVLEDSWYMGSDISI